MPEIRNVSPLGDLHVLRQLVPAGATFTVSDEEAEALLQQPTNWQLVKTVKESA